jgi:plastocyanin
MRVGRLAVMALVAGAVAGSAAAAPHTVTITIKDLGFGSGPADVHVGDTLTWVNDDIFDHTATARDGAFDLKLAPKASGTVVLKRAGTYEIYCRYHPGMTLKIVVAP